jgi:hypothetical protein
MLFDSEHPDSLVTRMRVRRLRLLAELINDLPQPVRVLDVGGTQHYWRLMGWLDEGKPQLEVTVINIEHPPDEFEPDPRVTIVHGNGCSMPQYSAGQFDLVFSNSVIEHVGDRAARRQMADEIKRLGPRYLVQTPNKYFPIEPHFLFPLFQFLPMGVRAWLLNHFRLGWMPRRGDKERARRIVESVDLLDRREMTELFPEATLHRERFGLVKSFTAIKR